MNKLKSIAEYLNKHLDLCAIGLFVMCYIFLFHHLGSYPLIDVDETRYASMAREIVEKSDWLTMYLNYNVFFEKPPLYFWMLAASYIFFGKVTEFAARFPIALIATAITFYTYYFGRKIISKSFGFMSSLILLTSIQFLVLARIAIIDMVLSSLIIASIYSGFLTLFCEEKNKKYLWWLAYLFSALAVLAKGLPGFIVPAAVFGISFIITGKFKEIFKPIYIIPGLLIFLAVSLPWHIMMYQEHGMAFINEYIIKHHLARFIDSKGLGRKEPFYFFIPVLLVGFFPWTFSFIALLINRTKKLYSQFKNKIQTEESDRAKLLLTLLTSYFVVVFLFFSSASTKLATYILPLFPAVAMLTAYYWYEFIKDNKNKNGITITTAILNVICLIVGIAAVVIPSNISSKIPDISSLKAIISVWFIIIPAVSLITLYFKKRVLTFAAQIAFMAGVILISINYVIPIVYNSGENELVSYAQYAKNISNSSLTAFGYGVRPSVLFYYGKKVNFIVKQDYPTLKDDIGNNKASLVIVKNKYINEISKNISFKPVKKGKKYTLISEISFK